MRAIAVGNRVLVKTRVVNVVATASLGQRIDLDALGEFREIIHDPEIYGGLAAYFKDNTMKGKVSIFNSGKVISVGTTSKKEAFDDLEHVKDFLVNKEFIDPISIEPEVRNMVVTASFRRNVDLEYVARKHKMIYEPDQFPGGIAKFEAPFRATVLLFASGKVVITGLTSSAQINVLLEKIKELFNGDEFAF